MGTLGVLLLLHSLESSDESFPGMYHFRLQGDGLFIYFENVYPAILIKIALGGLQKNLKK